MTGLSWLLRFAIATCIAALFVCGAMFVNQRKSTSTQTVESAPPSYAPRPSVPQSSAPHPASPRPSSPEDSTFAAFDPTGIS